MINQRERYKTSIQRKKVSKAEQTIMMKKKKKVVVNLSSSPGTASGTATGRVKKETVAGIKLGKEQGLVFKTTLNDKEYVYLNASEFGEAEVVRDLMEDESLNLNCVDYMGRNALLLAMKTENVELLDSLLGRLDYSAVEDALLQAISQERIHLVKRIIDHPQFIRLERNYISRRASTIEGVKNDRAIERSQFSQDITPLMLAAHTNNHEIIQLLLDRGHSLEMPHDRCCNCFDCELIRNEDTLILEIQRIHNYQALSSPAYLALTTSDPVASAFTLRNELYQLASQEKQFKLEYTNLAKQCIDFTVDCLDLCRTSDEVYSLLGGRLKKINTEQQSTMNTLKTAIQYREKKFVSHSNCQHQLENRFYGQMFCIRDFEGREKFEFFILFIPLLPVIYILYLFFPQLKIVEVLDCPVVKFIGHMLSYFTMLMLITVATFQLDADQDDEEDDFTKRSSERIIRYDFRDSKSIMTNIQIAILFWVMGQFFMECKQVYTYGLRDYFRSYYNFMDWGALALYLASYTLRIIVDFKVKHAEREFTRDLESIKVFLLRPANLSQELYFQKRNEFLLQEGTYWLRGCRLWWSQDDPEYVSDCLFALANVLSFARISYLMPAWELLGPLQISLARMITDIIRFMALFTVLVMAFVVGLTNLYWYFGKLMVRKNGRFSFASTIPGFDGTTATFHTLYWALFGQSSNNVTTIAEATVNDYPGHSLLSVKDSHTMITNMGSILYGAYNACMIIILLNMLIAMMSKSFDEIQGDRLEEWKFARSALWMVYIEQEGILPAPFNLLPSKDMLMKIVVSLRDTCQMMTASSTCLRKEEEGPPDQAQVEAHIVDNPQSSSSENHLRVKPKVKFLTPSISLTSDEDADDGELSALHKKMDHIRSNVIRRYLFKLQKQKEEANKSGDISMMNMLRQNQQQQVLSELRLSESERQSSLHSGTENNSELRGSHESVFSETKTSIVKPKWSQTLASRGLGSLLMPPSVRRKLEAAVELKDGGDSIEERFLASRSTEETMLTASLFLMETTKRSNPLADVNPYYPNARPLYPESIWNETDYFTSRNEKPIAGSHLREIYKVEQEMADMCETFSMYSVAEASISEACLLEDELKSSNPNVQANPPRRSRQKSSSKRSRPPLVRSD